MHRRQTQAALVLLAASYVLAPLSILLGDHNPLSTRYILLFDLYFSATLAFCARATGERAFAPAAALALLHAALCAVRPEISGGRSEWMLLATVPLMTTLVGVAGARLAHQTRRLVITIGFCATTIAAATSVCVQSFLGFLTTFAAQALLWLIFCCLLDPAPTPEHCGTGLNVAE